MLVRRGGEEDKVGRDEMGRGSQEGMEREGSDIAEGK